MKNMSKQLWSLTELHVADPMHACMHIHIRTPQGVILLATVRERESEGTGRLAVFLPDPTLDVKTPKETR